MQVFYGADRVLESDAGGGLAYGAEPAAQLSYGSVDVTIPPVHKRGNLERPLRIWSVELPENPQRHIVVKSFAPLSQQDFLAGVRARVEDSPGKQAFVFVHGFNTPFADAARRTAQLHHDLEFDGAPVFYSWPSLGELNPLAYARDATAADRTAPKLAQFLQTLREGTGAQKIHLIAHSMGNRALVQALDRLERNGLEDQAFHQIMLCAPDIDREVFADLAARIVPVARQITLYASKNDKALQASKSFNGFPRAGDAAPEPVVTSGIVTIDASAVTTDLFGFNHDFFADERSVLEDIGRVIATGARPEARDLRLRGAWWSIE